MTELEFDKWFAAKDLGKLEYARQAIREDAIDNSGEKVTDWDCAKGTVEFILDHPSMHQDYDSLRPRD